MLDIDTIILHTPELATLDRPGDIDRLRVTYDDQGAFAKVTCLAGDVRVTVGPSGTRVQGSVVRHRRGTNLADFDPADAGAVLDEVADRIGLDRSDLRAAAVRRVDIGVNVVVPRRPSVYVGAMRAPATMRALPFSEGSVVFENTVCRLASYDKVAERQANRHGVPERYRGAHVLRHELRVDRPHRVFRRRVTAGDLASPGFVDEARGVLLRRFDTIRFEPVARVEQAVTVSELKGEYAAIGVEASGGVDVAVRALREAEREGVLDGQQRRRQARWIAGLVRAGALTTGHDVATELRAALHEAVR